MRLVRRVIPALVAGLFGAGAVPLCAQDSTGVVTGKVLDVSTATPLVNVEVSIVGAPNRDLTKIDGTFTLTRLRAGAYRVRATRIGYGSQIQDVSIPAGGTATVTLSLAPAAAILEPVVVTGYGTQRREAITGSVSTVNAAAANVGVVTNVDQMLQGRAAGVEITSNDGEPGAGMQVLIRGGSSISATNAPLYVIDGVPVNNEATEPSALNPVGSPPLPRNPLNMLNPSDIASITVLKDAAATAIYGSRASNGVVLIETKKGGNAGGPSIEYDGYVSTQSAARSLDVLSGSEYAAFVKDQVTKGNLDPIHLQKLGSANTNWEDAVLRTSVTHNHNLSFSGGSDVTRYRASLNYGKEEGVAAPAGLERIQGRLSANHSDLNGRLRLGINVTTSRINNQYLCYENNGGFQGCVFENVATFNPTQPIMVTDSTGTHYYESGSTSVWNPVALANQLTDIGQTTRTFANGTADFDVVPGLTAKLNVGLDHSGGQRQQYFPNASPVGAFLGGGEAQQQDLESSTKTLQTVLNYTRQFGAGNSLDWVGGYEFSQFDRDSVTAQGIGFFTDAFSFNNLNAAVTRTTFSGASQSRLASFFTRANVGLSDRFFITGVLRYDGSSRFAVGHKWALFPALSGSWHLSQESFLQNGPFSDLRLRLGWGLQGNPGVDPYSSLITLAGGSGGSYAWGDTPQGGVTPTSNGNPNLKWEQTSQVDGAVDFGLFNNRLSGTVEYYVKNTKDLLLTINVPQPALSSTQLQNVGKLRNSGFEASLDALLVSHPGMTLRAGLVFSAERNKVIDLGPYTFLESGFVSGQGQSNQVSERIQPGFPIGTFYGPVFAGWDSNGKQLFQCTTAHTGASCVNGVTTTGNGPDAGDYQVIGNANPDFTLGLHSQLNWNRWDISFLARAVVGGDVFNNTALVYSTKGNALQDKNFLRPALTDPTGIHEPAIFSSRWIEDATFVRLQNVTVEYDLQLPVLARSARSARVYVSADNLVLLTGYSGLDPEVHTENGLATRGLDYLTYPRPRTITGGLRLTF